ncbi:phosphoadenylyl-sulfate reductase [Psychrosphaera sp. B3R10]|uniref:phosphoadenylyl-sulfate reductase n=1 Tax=unclassified Psychrosphaera TaxID=2641570 RepID=UPI001C092A7C|nr:MULTISPECIES: phosphoadenylyl-sulfate reductase [unclassified Psychrosphaera]MBU2883650.1 phosphoadenylyl-sulfate reductase [Psychrosphaera sp. I2R16]MBU2991000.1 phosphoadenylyl-sulfate reductase [Psychrosphaera sp. B3R10]MDO6719080.1 phosphoadenylyl-sulfate reductase [Psychrosphaera sp. 1_MG-2023]
MTSATAINEKNSGQGSELITDLAQINRDLSSLNAEKRVEWALENLPQQAMLSSSFGIQSAVMLHLVTQQMPDIPVVLTDTGYLFPETYQFIDQLAERLNLNLQIYRSDLSPAWQEARFGKLWEKGASGIKQYNQMNKVEPMRRALQELNVNTWFSGIRQGQSQSRAEKPVAEYSFIRGESQPVVKLHPILEWTNRDIYQYLQKHDLPYHPLWEEGYVSVGDMQTTQKLEAGMTEEETRFFGLTRECGLHEVSDGSGI